MEWSLVVDLLPLDMEEVLLFDDVKGMTIGYYYQPKNCFIQSIDGLRLTEVNNWMYLPVQPNNMYLLKRIPG